MQPDGRRDPFLNLLGTGTPSVRLAGAAKVRPASTVAEITVRGVLTAAAR